MDEAHRALFEWQAQVAKNVVISHIYPVFGVAASRHVGTLHMLVSLPQTSSAELVSAKFRTIGKKCL
jgi:hypothetical protein